MKKEVNTTTSTNVCNNQGRNNNRNVTFVEHISDVIRRNSTIPQAVSGELRITNGDVEGAITVNCSNAVYRASASCSSKDQKMPAEKEYDHSEYYKAKSFAEVSEIIKQELKASYADPSNDIIMLTIKYLIELGIISDLTYELDCRFAFIDGKTYQDNNLGSVLRYITNISEERAKEIDSILSDAVGCDLIIRGARKNGRILYRVTAECSKTGFVRCADNETMAQFINRITKK